MVKSNAPSAADYTWISWIFLRFIGVIYFSAFTSMAVQIKGLIGSNGILPIVNRLTAIENFLGEQRFWAFPTVFWIDASDNALVGVCLLGIAASILVILNFLTRLGLIVCFALYLSVTLGGQIFTQFQWDSFLLESGFLAIFLPFGSRIIIYLYRWLLFRFMFMSGLVKLASGDPTWWNLTALTYHYETQPLPSPLAWYVHHFPAWIHQISVVGVFVIELIMVFLIFMPRQLRMIGAWSIIILQTGIIATGNYNFFNLLTISLCLFLFDDQAILRIVPKTLVDYIALQKVKSGKLATHCATLLTVFVFSVCATYAWIGNLKTPVGSPMMTLVRIAQSFSLVNNYGPFAVMTRQRPEILIEGSYDRINWQSYRFKYKPDDPRKPLCWVIPHQPRLDWQMWFAALRPPHQHSWVIPFLHRLKEGSPSVLALLDYNPFPIRPPDYVRANVYLYTFTTRDLRAKTGDIWRRHFVRAFWSIGTGS